MRSLLAIAALAICTLSTAPQPAAAQGAQPVIARITPEALATAMTQAGWKSKVAVDANSKEKYVEIPFYQGKLNAFIDLFDCTAQGCSFVTFVIVFAASDKHTLEFSNNMNSRVRFVRSYRLDDGRLIILSDVDLTGGVTVRHLQEAGGNFEGAIGEYLKLAN
jgi:Putative bacterial sensory transduction regulator